MARPKSIAGSIASDLPGLSFVNSVDQWLKQSLAVYDRYDEHRVVSDSKDQTIAVDESLPNIGIGKFRDDTARFWRVS